MHRPDIPVDSRDVLVDSRGVLVDSRDVLVDSRGVPVNSRDVPVDSRGVPVNSRDVPVDSRGVLVDSRGVPVDSPDGFLRTHAAHRRPDADPTFARVRGGVRAARLPGRARPTRRRR